MSPGRRCPGGGHGHEAVGSFRRVLGEGGAADTGAGAGRGQAVQKGARRGQKEEARQAGVRGDSARPADGLPVEGAAQGGVRQRQLRPPPLPGVGEGRGLQEALGGGARGVRRHGGHSVALAEHRRRHGQGAHGERGGGAQPDRQGKKMGASATSWWTGVAPRSR